jgi:hypothetical protein
LSFEGVLSRSTPSYFHPYISEDGVEGSIRASRSNSMSEEGNENNIVEINEEVGGEEIFE